MAVSIAIRQVRKLPLNANCGRATANRRIADQVWPVAQSRLWPTSAHWWRYFQRPQSGALLPLILVVSVDRKRRPLVGYRHTSRAGRPPPCRSRL